MVWVKVIRILMCETTYRETIRQRFMKIKKKTLPQGKT